MYFKRNDNKGWHGPAKVGLLGCEKSQYLVKHGGNYVRVHPCRMQLVNVFDSHGSPGKMLLDAYSDVSKLKNVIDQSKNVVENENVDVCDSDDDVQTDLIHTAPITPPVTPPQRVGQHAQNNIVVQLQPVVEQPQQINDSNIEHVQNNQDRADGGTEEVEQAKIPRALARPHDFNSLGNKDTTS